jgi:hypothetical protein
MPTLDSTLLCSTLRVELRAAWTKIRADHAQERLYGFGAYTTDSASYLMVTAFSESGLESQVAKYLASERGKGSDPVLQRQTLRWSPCDSPLHQEGSDLLPKSDKIVDALNLEGDPDGEDFDEDDDDFDEGDEPDPAIAEVIAIAVQVLQEMDKEGLFGAGAERERLVLCVWKGDQSNMERYEFAKALNPPAVATRFGEELNEGNRAFYRVHMPDEQLPEDDVFD